MAFEILKLPVLDQKLCAIEGFQRVYLYRFLNKKSESKTGKMSVTKRERHVVGPSTRVKKHMNSIYITYMMQ